MQLLEMHETEMVKVKNEISFKLWIKKTENILMK